MKNLDFGYSSKKGYWIFKFNTFIFNFPLPNLANIDEYDGEDYETAVLMANLLSDTAIIVEELLKLLKSEQHG